MFENFNEIMEETQEELQGNGGVEQNAEQIDGESKIPGEGEAAEAAEEKESVGYSSDYYEHRMAEGLRSNNKPMYENAKKHWAEAKVRESVGSDDSEGEAAETADEKEAVGYSTIYYENPALSDLKHRREAHDNGMSIWANGSADSTNG